MSILQQRMQHNRLNIQKQKIGEWNGRDYQVEEESWRVRARSKELDQKQKNKFATFNRNQSQEQVLPVQGMSFGQSKLDAQVQTQQLYNQLVDQQTNTEQNQYYQDIQNEEIERQFQIKSLDELMNMGEEDQPPISYEDHQSEEQISYQQELQSQDQKQIEKKEFQTIYNANDINQSPDQRFQEQFEENDQNFEQQDDYQIEQMEESSQSQYSSQLQNQENEYQQIYEDDQMEKESDTHKKNYQSSSENQSSQKIYPKSELAPQQLDQQANIISYQNIRKKIKNESYQQNSPPRAILEARSLENMTWPYKNQESESQESYEISPKTRNPQLSLKAQFVRPVTQSYSINSKQALQQDFNFYMEQSIDNDLEKSIQKSAKNQAQIQQKFKNSEQKISQSQKSLIPIQKSESLKQENINDEIKIKAQEHIHKYSINNINKLFNEEAQVEIQKNNFKQNQSLLKNKQNKNLKKQGSKNIMTQVTVFGINNYGQLGFQKNPLENVLKESNQELIQNVIDKTQNDVDRQKEFLVEKPKILNFHIEVKEVACGFQHSHLLSIQGQVYSTGSNSYGQLGLGFTCEQLEKVYFPTLINNLTATKIRCGDDYSFALDKDGFAHGWGRVDFGAIGVRISASTEPAILKFPPSDSNQQVKIKDIQLGSNHSCFLTTQGQVYSCGKNDKGQLGIGFMTEKEFRPIVVRLRNHIEKIKQISCGINHTCFLTKSGKVFSAGNNENGQLGLGHQKNVSWPEQVPMDDIIFNKIQCGQYTSAIDNKGYYFAWGKFRNEIHLRPFSPDNVQVQFIDIFQNETLSAAIDIEDKLWMWTNQFLNDDKQNSNPLQLPNEATLYSPLKYQAVSQISLGHNFIIIITEDQPFIKLKKQEFENKPSDKVVPIRFQGLKKSLTTKEAIQAPPKQVSLNQDIEDVNIRVRFDEQNQQVINNYIHLRKKSKTLYTKTAMQQVDKPNQKLQEKINIYDNQKQNNRSSSFLRKKSPSQNVEFPKKLDFLRKSEIKQKVNKKEISQKYILRKREKSIGSQKQLPKFQNEKQRKNYQKTSIRNDNPYFQKYKFCSPLRQSVNMDQMQINQHQKHSVSNLQTRNNKENEGRNNYQIQNTNKLQRQRINHDQPNRDEALKKQNKQAILEYQLLLKQNELLKKELELLSNQDRYI